MIRPSASRLLLSGNPRHRFLILAHQLGILLIPLFAFTDWFLYPHVFRTLMGIRLITVTGLIFSLFYVRRNPGRKARRMTELGFLGVAMSFTWMCVITQEGLKSPYYAGTMLLILAASVLMDWSGDYLVSLLIAIPLQHILTLLLLPFEVSDLILNIFFLGGATALGYYLNKYVGRIRDQNAYLAQLFTHDLKNQLAAASSNLALWQKGSRDPQLLSNLQGNLRKAYLMGVNLLKQTRIPDRVITLDCTPYSLKSLEEMLQREWHPLFAAREIRFDLTLEHTMTLIDPTYMNLVWDNILMNAWENSEAGSSLTLHTRKQGSTITLHFSNEAPPVHATRIQQQLNASQARISQQGLGLETCLWITQAHGGKFEYRYDPPLHTFSITLPLA